MLKSAILKRSCLLILAVFAPAVMACGESMFRVGFVVDLPPGVAMRPSNVAIFRSDPASRDVFFDDEKVAAKLGRAGHNISVVSGSADTTAVQGFDVVIARADDLDLARSTLGSNAEGAVFVPVIQGFATASTGSSISLSSNSTLRQILGALQRAMNEAIG
jgi:hypothetical protein